MGSYSVGKPPIMSLDPVESHSLQLIASSIERIGRYTAGLEFEEFQADSMVQDAVLRNFEVISAETRTIAPARRAAHPGLPWNDMESLAARVLDDRTPRDPAAIWDVIQHDLPPLVAPLAEVLRNEPTSDGGAVDP